MKFRYRYAEAAEVLGISKAKIYRRIREGRLTPVYDGAQPFLTHDELLRYANAPQPNLDAFKARNPGCVGFQRRKTEATGLQPAPQAIAPQRAPLPRRNRTGS